MKMMLMVMVMMLMVMMMMKVRMMMMMMMKMKVMKVFPWTGGRGPPLAKISCRKSNGINGSSIGGPSIDLSETLASLADKHV